MPIADLFSAPASSKAVGTGRNGRNIQHSRAIEAFRPADRPVGTVGTDAQAAPACSDCSDRSEQRSEQEKPSNSAAVPTVPTVPTANAIVDDRCRWCGVPLAWPAPVGIILGDGSAECHACADREVWRLMAAADRALNSPDALADPAELTARGEALP